VQREGHTNIMNLAALSSRWFGRGKTFSICYKFVKGLPAKTVPALEAQFKSVKLYFAN